MTCQHTTTLGVYLLGALEPLDRSEFESHLSRCDICRGELVRLAPLPGLLNQISIEDFADDGPSAAVEPPSPGLVSLPVTEPVPVPPVPAQGPAPAPPAPELPSPPVIGDTPGVRDTPRRTRRYWQVAAAAAVVLVVTIGGIFGWRAIDGQSPPAPAGVTWSATGADDVRADARLIDHEWGTEIKVKVANLPPDRECYLIVRDEDGNRQVAGWWQTNHDPAAEIPASTSVARSKIVGLEIKLDDQSLAVAIPAPPR